MFERFTDRARHVVVLSQEEARLLSHNYIGTEHILLGLLGEPESIGGHVLEASASPSTASAGRSRRRSAGARAQPAGHIPFTPRAKKTLELSLREALSIKHNYIGTEHILLGVIREGEGVGAQILRDHADLLEIRAAVLNAVSAIDPGEEGEGSEETNAMLSWLRHRPSRHGQASPSARTCREPKPRRAVPRRSRPRCSRPHGWPGRCLSGLTTSSSRRLMTRTRRLPGPSPRLAWTSTS